MVQKAVARGAFDGDETAVQFVGDYMLKGDWVECSEGVPEFVYPENGWYGDEWQQNLERWVKWNGRYRTLQKKIDDDNYYIISKWIRRNCWTIEHWCRHSVNNRKPHLIKYSKSNLNAPTKDDVWFNCVFNTKSDVKVLNFPQDHTTVTGDILG